MGSVKILYRYKLTPSAVRLLPSTLIDHLFLPAAENDVTCFDCDRWSA